MKKDELINAIDKISMSESQKNSIYETVMAQKKHTKKSRIKQILPKVAGIVLAVGFFGAGTVYAANYIFNKINVSDHAIYSESGYDPIIEEIEAIIASGSKTNDSDNLVKDTSIDDLIKEKLMSTFEKEELTKEEPGPNDKWLSKSTNLITFTQSQSQSKSTEIIYPDHNTMIEDTGLENIFSDMSNLTQINTVFYAENDFGSAKVYSISEHFKYKYNGILFVDMSISTEESLGGRNLMSLSQLSLKGTYLSKTGIEYTIATEEPLTTDISPYPESIIASSSFGKYSIIIDTCLMTEEDVYEFLDTLTFAMD